MIKLHFCIAENFEHFICITLINFCPVIHFNFFNIFLSLFLSSRFFRSGSRIICLRFRWFSTFLILLALWKLGLNSLCLTTTESSKLISFFIIIIEICIFKSTNWWLLLYLSITWIKLLYMSSNTIFGRSSRLSWFDLKFWYAILTNRVLLFTYWSNFLTYFSRFTQTSKLIWWIVILRSKANWCYCLTISWSLNFWFFLIGGNLLWTSEHFGLWLMIWITMRKQLFFVRCSGWDISSLIVITIICWRICFWFYIIAECTSLYLMLRSLLICAVLSLRWHAI